MWAHALRVKVEGQGDEIDIARSLSIAIRGSVVSRRLLKDMGIYGPKQAALYSVSSRHLAQFCCCDTCNPSVTASATPWLAQLTASTVVVRVLPRTVSMTETWKLETKKVSHTRDTHTLSLSPMLVLKYSTKSA